MVSRLEVAEAMYQAGKGGAGRKMPDSLDELNAHTQARYLLLAGAAIDIVGESSAERASVPSLVLDLAEQLAFKLNHPTWFADSVREVLDRYVAVVGEGRVTDEVRRAMAI